MSLKAFSDGVGILPKDRGSHFSGDFADSFVVARLDACVVEGGVHDVGFHEDDRAVVEPVGE